MIDEMEHLIIGVDVEGATDVPDGSIIATDQIRIDASAGSGRSSYWS